jgi:uncharacterized protein YggT (Ycf19 family)
LFDIKRIMGLMVTEPIGLIIAVLNVISFLLLVHLFLRLVVEERSRLYRVLDRIFAPILSPMNAVLPGERFSYASIALIVLLQVIAFALRRRTGV